ncbi:MAG: acyl-CoA synthetase (AMP-forming)/AMP-acid ligase II [Candidatus Poriferisodalaceae bacterium]|jgi:acyl-CoA synthetase (AMP-forming)/AMP-acid ligase II
MTWTFADIWETNAATVPDKAALVHGTRSISWREMNQRANGVATALLEAGVAQQDKVAQYLYNCPEYMESMFGVYKAGLVPVNTNYRYTADELVYLWVNSDAVAVVFHGSFVDTIEDIRAKVPGVTTWLWVDDGSGPCPSWATAYETSAARGSEHNVSGSWGRNPDDLYMLYTGGTTGMPKGVMWPQSELMKLQRTIDRKLPFEADYDYVAAKAPRTKDVYVPCCPLMHGTGAFGAFQALHTGGTVVTLESRSFDAAELFDATDRNGVTRIAIVGDAFAKPMLRALESQPDRWNLDSMFAIISSGVMFSQESKEALLEHIPQAMVVDSFGSSEAIGMGSSVSSKDKAVSTAKFDLGDKAIVVDDDGNRVIAGSGVMGRVAVKGILPVGYYKDPEKSAKTFITIEGERYSTPGDYAYVEADGSLTLLGRGSVCINTGGEKVFVEEVEEALKRHAAIRDAVVVGIPDEKFGQAVTGVVEVNASADFDESDVIAHVKLTLAAYKAPKRLVSIDSIGRAANGKVDYKRLTTYATDQLTQP